VKSFLADLHVHTALSPCAGEEMTPPAIVQAALDCGLSMVAICDHNSAGNVAAAQEAARAACARGLRHSASAAPCDVLSVIPGMEITTAEEVHVVGLFPDAEAAQAAAAEVQATLPEADAEYYQRFGPQRQLDAQGRLVGLERRMLAAASTLSLAQTVALIHQHGGLAVAAHVDRPSFSVMSQLGMFPTDAGFDAIELFVPCGGAGGAAPRPVQDPVRWAVWGLPIVWSSDAHFLNDVGRCRTAFTIMAPTFSELVQALRGVDGRSVRGA